MMGEIDKHHMSSCFGTLQNIQNTARFYMEIILDEAHPTSNCFSVMELSWKAREWYVCLITVLGGTHRYLAATSPFHVLHQP